MVYTLPGMRLPTMPSSAYNNNNRWSSHGHRKTDNISFYLQNKSPFSRKIFSRNPYESASQSSKAAASEKLLVPGTENYATTAAEKLDVPEIASDNSQVNEDGHRSSIEASRGEDSASVPTQDEYVDVKERTSDSTDEKIGYESSRVRDRGMTPPGVGQRIYEIDPLLNNYREHLDYRYDQYKKLSEAIDKYEGGLEKFSRGYEKLGFNRSETGITYREWAPGAKSATLIGDFNNWNPNANVLTRDEFGVWEIFLPNKADGSPTIPHGSRVKIRMDTPSGIKDSIQLG